MFSHSYPHPIEAPSISVIALCPTRSRSYSDIFLIHPFISSSSPFATHRTSPPSPAHTYACAERTLVASVSTLISPLSLKPTHSIASQRIISQRSRYPSKLPRSKSTATRKTKRNNAHRYPPSTAHSTPCTPPGHNSTFPRPRACFPGRSRRSCIRR